MKKTILAVLALTAFTIKAQAQTPDLKLGAKAGINYSIIDRSEADYKIGFNIGVVAEYFINEKFSIQPEILYSSQGAKVSEYDFDLILNTKKEHTISLDYINIPIMAKYYVYKGFNVQAGPQIGFLTKAEIESKTTIIVTEKVTEKVTKNNIKDDTNSVDFGLNFGLGYELPIGVFFDARYNLGLSNLNKDGDDKFSNRVLQISVGYKF